MKTRKNQILLGLLIAGVIITTAFDILADAGNCAVDPNDGSCPPGPCTTSYSGGIGGQPPNTYIIPSTSGTGACHSYTRLVSAYGAGDPFGCSCY